MKAIIKWILKIFLGGFFGIILITGMVLSLFWLEHKREVILPSPTGSFGVGRTTFDWIDSSRIDTLGPTRGVKRELVVWVWYPVSKTESTSANEYLPSDWQKAVEERQGFLMTKLMTTEISKVHSHSVRNAKLSSAQARYPILLMKSGIGALATDYTTLAEDLASHGYIVVGSDSPYSTFVIVFPDGRVVGRSEQGSPGEAAPFKQRSDRADRLVTIWSNDTRFIVNRLEQLNASDSSGQFRGRLDLQAVGVFGHSFGGATALQFCRDEPRCKAGIDVDGAPFGGVVQTGLSKPFMFLLADHSEESDSIGNSIKRKIESIYDQLPEGRVWITLGGSRHFNFSDQALLKERFLARRFGMLGPIGEQRGLQIARSCLRAFFDVHLKGESPDKIKDLARQYHEVRFDKY
jgi:pimeloyl-ACP methyl ester carboxylesterase